MSSTYELKWKAELHFPQCSVAVTGQVFLCLDLMMMSRAYLLLLR